MTFDELSSDDSTDREVFNLPQATREELESIIEDNDVKVQGAPNTPLTSSHFFEFQDRYPRTRFISHLVTIDSEPTRLVIEGVKYRGPADSDLLVDFIRDFGSAHEFQVKGYDKDTVKLRAWYD